MNKKVLILTIILGLAGFAGAFLTAFLTGGKTPEAQPQPTQNQDPAEQLVTNIRQRYPANASAGDTSQAAALALTERHLKNLIHDIREKMDEYNNKLKGLEQREDRIKITQQQLQKDIDELATLRTEVASMVASLKQQRQKLIETRIEIEQSEKNNLMQIAATYDKMNPTSAGEIFTNMTRAGQPGGEGLNDVVKIMYYMNDRNKAKVLGELVGTEPKLAALLSTELKRIREVTQ